MQSTNESAVRTLLSHINNVESERRVTMMKLKEAEIRLQGKETQRANLLRETSTLRDKELSGKARLSQLLSEQDALSRQLANGTEAIKKAEGQEQYLLAHNKETRLTAEAQKRVWEGRSAELRDLGSAWLEGCSVGKFKQEIAAADAKLDVINQQEKSLLHKIAAAAARRQELASQKVAAAAEAATRASSTLSVSSPVKKLLSDNNDEAERMSLQATLDALRRDVQDHTIRVIPQRDTLRCEVQQLERRTKEMTAVALEMTTGTTSILATCQRLEESAQRRLCPRCIAD